AKGGVLGRKLGLIVRDSKADANEAVRQARELILKDNVEFLVGTLTSAEGPAVSVVAKENKIVFIAPIPKTDQLTAPDKLHPYIFRVASNTTIEGRSAAEIVAKWPVTKVATMSFDYAYGQDVSKQFVEHLKKIKPSVEIVDQQGRNGGQQGLHGAPVQVLERRVPVVVGDPGLHRHAVPGRGHQEGRQHGLGQGRQGAARADGRDADGPADDPREGPPGQPRPALR